MTEIKIVPAFAQLVPGQSQRVGITLIVDKPIKVRGLHATFWGAEETKATYTSYNAATKTTQTHTAVEHSEIVKSEFILSGDERKGFFGNIADGLATMVGAGDHEVLEPGEYSFEVDVQVPEGAPAGFKAKNCRVFYQLEVRVDIPMWPDAKKVYEFELPEINPSVIQPVGPKKTRYPEDQDRGLFDSLFAPDIRVEAAVAEGVIADGDMVQGIFSVETQKPLNYKSIQVRLIAIEKTQAQGHSATHIHAGDPIEIAQEGVVEGEYTREFSLAFANPGAVSSAGKSYSVECFLQIELDVPWAKDPKIRVPVVYTTVRSEST